eukprot:356459-Chlamydomonas_euryale.AAC.5
MPVAQPVDLLQGGAYGAAALVRTYVHPYGAAAALVHGLPSDLSCSSPQTCLSPAEQLRLTKPGLATAAVATALLPHALQHPVRHTSGRAAERLDSEDSHAQRQAGRRVEHGQPVARARHDLEQLGDAVDKVDNLRDEEEQQRLAEVAQDARDRDRHARKICKRAERAARERQREVGREEVRVTCRVAAGADAPRDRRQAVRQHRTRDDKRLAGLQAVDSREDVDAVRAEDDKRDHVAEVQRPQLHIAGQPDEQLQRLGHRNARATAVSREQRQRRKQWQHELHAPAQVEHVVCKAEEHHEADRREGGIVVNEPRLVNRAAQHGRRPGEARCDPREQRRRVKVVQHLEHSDAQQEDTANGEAGRLGDRHLAERRALLVEVLAADAARARLLADVRHEPHGADAAGGRYGGARRDERARAVVGDPAERRGGR